MIGLAAALLISAPLAAADAVEITALRHPVDRSYRSMVKGMDLFEERRALAPLASLRYKLLPREDGADLRGVAVHIVAESFELPVAVAPDRTFTLERDRKALEEDARVRAERTAQSLTWRAEIRTPGLPASARRLGDLRLECRVGMAAGLVSRYPSSLLGRLLERFRSPDAFCSERYVPYLFFAERPLFGVTLSAGSRRQSLSVGQLYAGAFLGRTPKEDLPYCDCQAVLDRAYVLPLGDPSWPDDTRVELEYVDTPAAAEDASLAGWSKAEIAAVFGEPAVLHLDDGFELWAYRFDPGKETLGQSEFVALFAPSGTVTKARLRPAP